MRAVLSCSAPHACYYSIDAAGLPDCFLLAGAVGALASWAEARLAGASLARIRGQEADARTRTALGEGTPRLQAVACPGMRAEAAGGMGGPQARQAAALASAVVLVAGADYARATAQVQEAQARTPVAAAVAVAAAGPGRNPVVVVQVVVAQHLQPRLRVTCACGRCQCAAVQAESCRSGDVVIGRRAA